MSADIGQEFIRIGRRVLRLAPGSNVRPGWLDLPVAFQVLTTDPAGRLSDLLAPLLTTLGPPSLADRASRAETHSHRPLPAVDQTGRRPAIRPSELSGRTQQLAGPASPATSSWEPRVRPSGRVGAREVPGSSWPAVRPDLSSVIAPRSFGSAAARQSPAESGRYVAEFGSLPAIAAVYQAMQAFHLAPADSADPRDRPTSDQAGSPRAKEAVPVEKAKHPDVPVAVVPPAPSAETAAPDPGALADLVTPATPEARFAPEWSLEHGESRTATPPVGEIAGEPSRWENGAGSGGNRPLPAPSGPEPSATRLVRGSGALTALLAAQVPTSRIEAPPVRPTGSTESRLTTPPRSTSQPEQGLPPAGQISPGEPDPSRLLDQLADRLEIELLRTYGTSGG